jgi:hypothetical protein
MNFDSFYNSNPNLKLKLLRALVLKYKGFITGAEVENDIAIFGSNEAVASINEIKNNQNFQDLLKRIKSDTAASDKERYILEKFTGSMLGSYLTHDLLTNPSVFPDYNLIKDNSADILKFGGLIDTLAVIFEPIGTGENFPDVLIKKDSTSYHSMKESCNTIEVNNDKLLTKILFESLSQEEKQLIVSEHNIAIGAIDYYPQPAKKTSTKSTETEEIDLSQDVELFRRSGENSGYVYQRKNKKWYTRKETATEWIELTSNKFQSSIDLLNAEIERQLVNDSAATATANQNTQNPQKTYDVASFSNFLANNPQRLPYYLARKTKKITKSAINESISKPSDNFPNMSAFVIKKNAYSKSTRNDNYLSVFFGAVSQLELSKCVPYLSLTFFNKRSKNEKSLLNMSNVGFMKFEKDGFGTFNSVWDNFSNTATPNFMSKDETLNSVGYMDLFTAPQTMVNSEINSKRTSGLFDFGNDNSDYLGELNNVIDPMAPLMTLKNFSATINGGGDFMITNRRAKLSVVLHDRSRLQEIAPLVSLNQLARTVIKVEHGWSHPDGDPIRSNNDIGKFLNSLRETHIYQLTSSDFSFSGNEVTINMTLDFFGSTDFKTTSIALGNEKKDSELSAMLIELIDDMEKNNRITSAGIDNPNSPGAPGQIALYGKSKDEKKKAAAIHKNIKVIRNSVMSVDFLLPANKIQELKSEIEKIQIATLDGEFIETFNHARVIKKYFEMLGILQVDSNDMTASDLIDFLEGGITASLFEKVKKNIAERIITKINSAVDTCPVKAGETYTNVALSNDPLYQAYQAYKLDRGEETYTNVALSNDPFKDPLCWSYSKNLEINQVIGYPDNHVSLGKLITNLIGLPMATGGENKYSEVQLLFYPINNNAAGARKYTTASIPINIQAIKSMIYKSVKSESDLTTRGIFDLLSNYFQNDNLQIYGLDEVSDAGIKKREEEIKKEENFEKNAFKKYQTLNGKLPQTDKQKIAAKQTYLKSRLKKFKSQTLKSSLTQIYENDGLDVAKTDFYRKPVIHLELEVVSAIKPKSINALNDANLLEIYSNYFKNQFDVTEEDLNEIKGVDDSKKILKIHVYDENANSRPAETMFMEGSVDPSRFLPVAGALSNANAEDNLNESIRVFKSESAKFIEKMSISEIKQYVKRSFPSITYGSQQAVVKSINVSSSTTDEIVNARLHESIYQQEQKEKAGSTKELPVKKDIEEFLVPTSIDVAIYGCPFISMGLNIFVDLSTGTDLDNVYMVGDVTHTITAGEYTTSLSLFLPQIGTTKQIKSQLISAIQTIDTEKLKENLSKVID